MHSAQSILAEIRRVRLLPIDPFWNREVFDRLGKGERLHYLAKRGVSVEAMTGHLVSIGMLPAEFDSIAFLAWFDSALQEVSGKRSQAKPKPIEHSDTDAELAATLAEYHATIQTSPESEKERRNRNRRHECSQCHAIVWHSGIEARFLCLPCLSASLVDALGESGATALIDSARMVYAPIDGIARTAQKPIPPHIRRNQTESIPF